MSAIIPLMPNAQEPKKTAAPAGKKGAVIPLPNSPERKDWGVMSDSLKLPQHAAASAGATPDEAAQEMRNLLLRVVANNEAYEALILKCAGRQIAATLKSEVGTRRNADELLGFLKSRLWNRRRDGAQTVVKPGKEATTNDIIRSWNPHLNGIVKYIQANTSMILQRDWKRFQAETHIPGQQSLQAIEESGRELDSTGRFVTARRDGAELADEPADVVESDEEFQRLSEIRRRGREEPLEPDEEAAVSGEQPEEDGEVLLTGPEQMFLVAEAASRKIPYQHITLFTAEHPDYRLFATAMQTDLVEPEMTTEERRTQLKKLANELVQVHCSDAPDFKKIVEEVAEWDPHEMSFASYAPSVCLDVAQGLRAAGPKEFSPGACQATMFLDFEALAQSISNQTTRLPARPKNTGLLQWNEMTDALSVWFEARAETVEDLEDPARPDYLALCCLTGQTPVKNIKPDAMAQSLKSMLNSWTGSMVDRAKMIGEKGASVLAQHYGAVTEMRTRMTTWNPLTDGYAGERMVTTLAEISQEQKEQENQQRAKEAQQEAAKKQTSPQPNPIEHIPRVAEDSATIDFLTNLNLDRTVRPPERPFWEPAPHN